MKIVGIVGGVASGKSSAAKIFKEHGATVLSADEIGHEILREPEILKAAEERWGSDVIDPSGEIDRQWLATVVFSEEGNGEDLQFLEQLTHPRIKSHVLTEINRLRSEGTHIAILDAALLMETGWNSMCQKIVFIDTSTEVREKYAAERDWTKQELFRRESRQLSLEKKRASADFIICNNGSMESLRQEISRVWDSLQASEMAD